MARKVKISNHDIIPLALQQLDGAGKFVDVEDIFMRCYEISPERFGWRKYELPNYKIIYKALVDYEDRYPDHLLKTPDGLSRQLSAEGVDWIRRKQPVFEKLLGSPEKIPPSRRPSQKLLNELTQSGLFRDFMLGQELSMEKYEVADLLLCSPDSSQSLWRERIETYRSAATLSKRYDIVEFLDLLLKKQPNWFGG